jgi:hypothetical protein
MYCFRGHDPEYLPASFKLDHAEMARLHLELKATSSDFRAPRR